MIRVPTRLQGLVLLGLEEGENGKGEIFPDSRGEYVSCFDREKLEGFGINMAGNWKTAYSFSHERVVRGIHAEPWDKLIQVAVGRTYSVEVDLRPESPTFGEF